MAGQSGMRVYTFYILAKTTSQTFLYELYFFMHELYLRPTLS